MSKRKPAQTNTPRLGVGELEQQVMGVLWDDGGHLTAAEVNARLAADRELAYTTVMTVLVRLWEKGSITRERRGRAWAYRPVLGREEQTAQRMNALLRGGGDESIALARFLENMTQTERAQLQALLDARNRTR
jgi:predicted transcriptional regulator